MKKYSADWDLLSELKKQVQKVKNEINRLPKGTLMICSRGDKLQYFRVTWTKDGKRKRVLIDCEEELIYNLAHKAFLLEKQRRLEEDIFLCKKTLKGWHPLNDQAIIGALPKHFESLEYSAVINPAFRKGAVFRPYPVNDGTCAPVCAKTHIGSVSLDEWAIQPYCANTKYEERKIHRTSNGLLCRSKGEVALIELCNRLGYRYHYDETIWIDDRLCSPDLIIVRKDGSLVYVEHRGWKGENYERANLEKDVLYFGAGIRQGRNYLITFESDDGGIDVELVEMQLRKIVEL